MVNVVLSLLVLPSFSIDKLAGDQKVCGHFWNDMIKKFARFSIFVILSSAARINNIN